MMRNPLVFLLIIIGVAFNSTPSTANSKKRPPPIRCTGAETNAQGEALVISPSLQRPLNKKEKRLLITNREALGSPRSEKKTLTLKLEPAVVGNSYKSLQHYMNKNTFTGPVTVSLLPNGGTVNLQELQDEIVSKWKRKNPGEPETLFLQLELGTATVIASIQYHDSTEECLKTSTISEALKTKDSIVAKIPKAIDFGLPVKGPFIVTYFFGPRIFKSMHPSINMEMNSEKNPDVEISPVSLATPAKPVQYLNKYWNFHSGIDFSVPRNTPLYAPYEGTVFAYGPMGCAGNTLIISHTLPDKRTVYSMYEHLQSAAKKIKLGSPVRKGQFIARSGKTGDKIKFTHGFKDGCVGGAHLHFEIRAPKPLAIATEERQLGKRFLFVQTQTITVNPSDYVSEVDEACQTRKNAELKNVILLSQKKPHAIPPITAGLCGYAYEGRLKDQPKLYQLTREKSDPIESKQVSVTSPNEPSNTPL